MFNFTTLTIFNNIVSATEQLIRDKQVKDYNVITKTGSRGPEVRIGNTRFNAANVISILKKVHTVENLAKVEFDLSKIENILTKVNSQDTLPGNYRIVLYIGLSMGSLDSFYSNDFVYKGKPLFIEFSLKNGDEAEAKNVVKVADKYLLFTALEKILNVTSDGTKVIFEGVNGYQQIKKAVLQKYDPNARTINCCEGDGDFIDLIKGVPVVYTLDDDGKVVDTESDKVYVGPNDDPRDLEDDEVAIKPGIEAFCDYNWIMHNLRLPTLANTNFWSVTKPEMPVPGAVYNQYIIRMCVDRDGIAGGVLGQRATTVTTHVLYVLDDAAGANDAEIQQVLSSLGTIKTDADDALKNPFA